MKKQTDILEVFRAGWWMVPIVVAVALGSVAYLTSHKAPPVYQTAATLAVVPHLSLKNENQMLRCLEVLDQRTVVVTLSRISASKSVLAKAANRIKTPLNELRDYEVRTSAMPGTHLIGVTVKGPDQDIVSRFATAVIQVAIEDASSYYPIFALKIMEGPGGRAQPVDRGVRRSYAVAGLLGLFLGSGAAYGVGLHRMTSRNRDAESAHISPKPESQRWA